MDPEYDDAPSAPAPGDRALTDAAPDDFVPADAAPADPAPRHAFALRLGDELALRLSERHHAAGLYARIDAERERLARAFGWARNATPASIEARLRAALEQFRRGDGWHADLCWRGRPVGAMWLHFLQGAGGSTEVGYWLGAEVVGRGLVTRAMRGLQRHFFQGHGLGRVAIGVDPRNAESAAVPRRLGYQDEAVLRHAYRGPDGEPAHLALAGLLREAWEAGPDAGPDAPPLPLPRFALYVDDDLALGLLERADAEALHTLVVTNRPRLARWMPWAYAPTLASTRQFIEQRALPAIAEADGFECGVWWRGRLVGAAGIHEVYRDPLRGSLGYWLAAEAEGQGLVTRAMRAIIDKAFEDHGYERIDLRADVANTRSRAVAERLGLHFEGVLRREFWNGRNYVDLAVYSLLRAEWPAWRVRTTVS